MNKHRAHSLVSGANSLIAPSFIFLPIDGREIVIDKRKWTVFIVSPTAERQIFTNYDFDYSPCSCSTCSCNYACGIILRKKSDEIFVKSWTATDIIYCFFFVVDEVCNYIFSFQCECPYVTDSVWLIDWLYCNCFWENNHQFCWSNAKFLCPIINQWIFEYPEFARQFHWPLIFRLQSDFGRGKPAKPRLYLINSIISNSIV